MKFVNVYEASQAYGGPEEGGWWYTHLEPVKTVRARRKRQQRCAYREMLTKFPPLERGKRLGQITGGNPGDLDSCEDFEPNDMTGVSTLSEFRVLIERHPARPTPRRYYE